MNLLPKTINSNRFSAIVLITVPLIYFSVTGHVWEDFLITFKHSFNWANGLGLGYEANKPLHGFTSPLNVIIPTIITYLSGANDFSVPLFFYSIISLSFLTAGGLLLVRFLSQLEINSTSKVAWLFPIILVLNPKVTAYAMNGQEAGFWVLFLTITFVSLHRGLHHAWLMAGLGWAGLMWTRPDSPIHISLVALTAILIPLSSRKSEIIGIIKAAFVCTLLYLPWFVWAWVYFGSPIPHTVTAKSGAYYSKTYLLSDLFKLESYFVQQLIRPFMPIYSWVGNWPLFLQAGMLGISLFIIFSTIWIKDRACRLSGILYMGSILYLVIMDASGMAFPWYYIPPAFFGTIYIVRSIQVSIKHQRRPLFIHCTKYSILALFSVSFIGALRQIEFQQRVVENGVRKQVGIYLKNAAQPSDSVYLEPIGYIGYFSGLKLLDYPGLVSPEVIAARQEKGLNSYELPSYFMPEWIVLRPSEYNIFSKHSSVSDQYSIAQFISRREEVLNERFLPGKNYPLTDAAFFILKKNSVSQENE
jgi:hypothetical protein